MEQEVATWFKMVPWHHLLWYLRAGWEPPTVGMVYPQIDQYGTTMEWTGSGDPPVFKGD